MRRPVRATVLVLLVLGTCVGGPDCNAQDLARPDVKRLVDSVAQVHVGPHAIPSAVAAVVQDTSVVFAGGYGTADLSSGRPPEPARTLYRVGSITKLFTATAALQLVEQGRVALHTDVNRYLKDLQIPDRFDAPITLHHLLTHTPGFEERFVGMGVRDSSERLSLGTYLRRELPRRVRPPGTVASYSNHGMALAGHLAATVADTPYVDLVQTRVLTPLGMSRSAAAARALPGSLRAALAPPYHRVNGTLVSPPETYGHLTPAGGLVVTATDMARFLIAHLNEGQTSDGRILAPETTRRMHRQQFTHHPSLAGWAYGFAEHPRSSPRILMHGGGARGYTALLWLVPERDLGVFVVCNLPDASFQDALLDAFNDRFLAPLNTTGMSADAGISPLNPSVATGHYRHVRRAHTTFEKVLGFTSHVHVADTDSGLVAEGLASSPVRLQPLGDGKFQRSDGGTVVFDGPDHGQAARLYTDAPLAPAYESVSVWVSPTVQGAIMGGLALIFLGAILGAVVGWWRGRKALAHESWTAAGVGAAYLTFFVGFPWAFLAGPQGHTLSFFFGVSTTLKAMLLLPLLALMSTAYLTVRIVRAWWEGTGLGAAHLGLAVVIVASGACGMLLHHWNLLGWQF